MSAELRPMQETDLAAVLVLDAATDGFPWGAANFRDALGAGYSSWVLEAGGEVLGFAVLMSVLDEAHLLKITIAPQRQGQGLGAGLLARLVERAQAAGARQLLLEVRASNAAAQRLYLRNGFAEIGRRKGYYPAADGREEAIVMSRAL